MEYKETYVKENMEKHFTDNNECDNDDGIWNHSDVTNLVLDTALVMNYHEFCGDELFVLLMDIKNNIDVHFDVHEIYDMLIDESTSAKHKRIILCIFILEADKKNIDGIPQFEALIDACDACMQIDQALYTNLLLHLSNMFCIRMKVEDLERLCVPDLTFFAKKNVLNLIINSFEVSDGKFVMESAREICLNEAIHDLIISSIDLDESKLLFTYILTLDLSPDEIKHEFDIINQIIDENEPD